MAMLEDRESSGPEALEQAIAEPLLFEGQRLDQPTFHAIYERMPEDFKAELIDGVVYLMNMPLHADHADPDSFLIGLLFVYSIDTPGTKVRNNITTILGPRSEVQPDSCLSILPENGGRSRLDEKGVMVDAPELVIEVAASSLKKDLKAKKQVYEEAGALEYVVYDAKKGKFHWFALEDGRFAPLPADVDGIFHSKVFPGLWIDGGAFRADDIQAAAACLRRGLASAEHVDFVERLRQNRANRP